MKLIFVLFAGCCISVAADADIRSLTWGMSVPAALEIEGKPLIRIPGGVLGYEVTLGTRKAAMYLEFAADKLATMSYVLTDEFTEPNRYVDIAYEWAATLTEKYGKSTKTVNWRNDLFKGDAGKFGRAVSAGHVRSEEKWKTDRTDIRLLLSGDNFKTTLVIVYESRDLVEALRSQKGNATKSVF